VTAELDEQPEEVSEDFQCHECGSDEEARRPKPVRNPGNPTKAEIEEHEVTHIPYRSWCSHCVRGKAVDDHHEAQKPEGGETSEQSLPRISIDYCFWCSKGNLRKDGDLKE
jgi:hypothetical protein